MEKLVSLISRALRGPGLSRWWNDRETDIHPHWHQSSSTTIHSSINVNRSRRDEHRRETSDFQTMQGQLRATIHGVTFNSLLSPYCSLIRSIWSVSDRRKTSLDILGIAVSFSFYLFEGCRSQTSMMDATMCHQTLGDSSPFVSISKEESWQRVFWRILEKKKQKESIHYHLYFFTLIIEQSFNTSHSTKLLPTEHAFDEVRITGALWEIGAFSDRSSLLLLIFLICLTSVWSSLNAGTLTSQFGRISNMANEQIHVSASLTLSECVRQCADFSHYYLQYYDEDCFAYNYDTKEYTCELIHSREPLNYLVGFQTQWLTGLKQQAWFFVLSLINKLFEGNRKIAFITHWFGVICKKKPVLFFMSTG